MCIINMDVSAIVLEIAMCLPYPSVISLFATSKTIRQVGTQYMWYTWVKTTMDCNAVSDWETIARFTYAGVLTSTKSDACVTTENYDAVVLDLLALATHAGIDEHFMYYENLLLMKTVHQQYNVPMMKLIHKCAGNTISYDTLFASTVSLEDMETIDFCVTTTHDASIKTCCTALELGAGRSVIARIVKHMTVPDANTLFNALMLGKVVLPNTCVPAVQKDEHIDPKDVLVQSIKYCETIISLALINDPRVTAEYKHLEMAMKSSDTCVVLAILSRGHIVHTKRARERVRYWAVMKEYQHWPLHQRNIIDEALSVRRPGNTRMVVQARPRAF